MQRLHPQKNKIWVSIVTIFVLWGVLNFTSIGTVLRSTLRDTFAPLVGLGTDAGRSVNGFTKNISRISTVQDDYDELETEVSALRASLALTETLEEENRRLRALLELVPRKEYDLVGADVIGYDLSGGGQWILIDRGAKSGLKKGMNVITGESTLIGQISEISPRGARVQLITHSEVIMNVQDLNTGIQMILRGEHGVGLVAQEIPRDADIKIGTVITTRKSDTDDVRKDLAVGVVQKIEMSQDKLVQEARLKPLFTPLSLREVFIIRGESL